MTRHEQTKTKRQEWNEFSNEIQKNVNETLDDIRLEIEAANMMLAEKYVTDPEAAGELSSEIVSFLDAKWGFTGDHFMVSGQWYEPTIGLSDEGILSRHVKKEVLQTARSNGFIVSVRDDGDGEVPYVGMSFIVASAAHATPSIQGNFQLLSFAKLEEISLQYMRPGDETVVSSEIGEVGDTIMRADSLLYLYTNHQQSSFYRQSAKKQEAFLRSIIDLVDDVLPAPDSLDRVMLHEAKSPVVYMKNPEGAGVAHLQARNMQIPFSVTGQVIGVTIHDLLEDGFGKRYTSPEDLAAVGTGISLIVKPHQINFDFEKYSGQDILLPLRAIDTLSLQIV